MPDQTTLGAFADRDAGDSSGTDADSTAAVDSAADGPGEGPSETALALADVLLQQGHTDLAHLERAAGGGPAFTDEEWAALDVGDQFVAMTRRLSEASADLTVGNQLRSEYGVD